MTRRPAKRYLSRTELAARIGVAPDSIGRYKLPPPDAMIGKVRGWTEETVDTWHAARPGRGWRSKPAEPPDNPGRHTFLGRVRPDTPAELAAVATLGWYVVDPESEHWSPATRAYLTVKQAEAKKNREEDERL